MSAETAERLPFDVRLLLIENFRERTRHAEAAFREACASLEPQMQPECVDVIPCHIRMMLDVIVSASCDILGMVLAQLRYISGGTSTWQCDELTLSRSDTASWAARSRDTLSGFSLGQVHTKLQRAVTSFHERPPAADGSRAGARDRALSYLDELDRSASMTFRSIRDSVPVLATDEELVLLFEGFEPRDHSKGMYAQQIASKIARYQTTAARIGVHRLRPGDPSPWGIGSTARLPDSSRPSCPEGLREKKVVRVTYGSGAPGHYGYVHRDWHPSSTTAPAPDLRQALLQAIGEGEAAARLQGAPYYAGSVASEFQEIALLHHWKAFAVEPDEFRIFEHEHPELFETDRRRRSHRRFAEAREQSLID